MAGGDGVDLKLVDFYCKRKDEKTLQEINDFSVFFEQMAASADRNVQTLLSVGVFEGIAPPLSEMVETFLLPKSIKLF